MFCTTKTEKMPTLAQWDAIHEKTQLRNSEMLQDRGKNAHCRMVHPWTLPRQTTYELSEGSQILQPYCHNFLIWKMSVVKEANSCCCKDEVIKGTLCKYLFVVFKNVAEYLWDSDSSPTKCKEQYTLKIGTDVWICINKEREQKRIADSMNGPVWTKWLRYYQEALCLYNLLILAIPGHTVPAQSLVRIHKVKIQVTC